MGAFNVFYLVVFSALAHKEMRFLLPILPFAMIMCATQIVSMRANYPFVDHVVKLYIIVELLVLGYLTAFH
jgi:predicted small integral membrane protein